MLSYQRQYYEYYSLKIKKYFKEVFIKDLFDRSHNSSHSTLYPDVLIIKTIIVEKNFGKMPFVYKLQTYKSISDNSAAWTAARLPDYGFVNNTQMAFLKIFVSQELLFLLSKHLDTTLNVTDCGTGRTDL